MTGFAASFTPTQQAALAALGYTLLEHTSNPPTPIGRALARRKPSPTESQPHTPGSESHTKIGVRVAPSNPGSESQRPAEAPPLPALIIIEGIDASALAQAVLAATRTTAGDARARRDADRLEITTRGSGDTWRLSLSRLRHSPRHKAALWRALRSLRRDDDGPQRPRA